MRFNEISRKTHVILKKAKKGWVTVFRTVVGYKTHVVNKDKTIKLKTDLKTDRSIEKAATSKKSYAGKGAAAMTAMMGVTMVASQQAYAETGNTNTVTVDKTSTSEFASKSEATINSQEERAESVKASESQSASEKAEEERSAEASRATSQSESAAAKSEEEARASASES